MGQEIGSEHFSRQDFAEFQRRLQAETALLQTGLREGRFSPRGGVGGFELEAWLVDDRSGDPLPVNQAFLETMNDPLVVPELAAFNVELNGHPQRLEGDALRRLHRDLEATWQRCLLGAARHGAQLLMIGILPTVDEDHLNLAQMSAVARYRALNQQVLALRDGRPLELEISGHEHLSTRHSDVMLEAAATSFQIHLKLRPPQAARVFNSAIIVSGPMVAVSANSPYLFGHDLWAETRIPLFEQAVACGRRSRPRVSFSTGYCRGGLDRCFEDNLLHYPVLLPVLSDESADRFPHLRLHNGTIWRWNRPLVGFDDDGRPHLRLEHRVVPAGPSLTDSLANTALFFGLATTLAGMEPAPESRLPFQAARDNFYACAREGLAARIRWLDGSELPVSRLLLEELLPLAAVGLESLGLDGADAGHYLGIIEERVRSGRNGAVWQRQWVARHGRDMHGLCHAYRLRQESGTPVHEWDI